MSIIRRRPFTKNDERLFDLGQIAERYVYDAASNRRLQLGLGFLYHFKAELMKVKILNKSIASAITEVMKYNNQRAMVMENGNWRKFSKKEVSDIMKDVAKKSLTFDSGMKKRFKETSNK